MIRLIYVRYVYLIDCRLYYKTRIKEVKLNPYCQIANKADYQELF